MNEDLAITPTQTLFIEGRGHVITVDLDTHPHLRVDQRTLIPLKGRTLFHEGVRWIINEVECFRGMGGMIKRDIGLIVTKTGATWQDVEEASISGRDRTGHPMRVIHLSKLRPLWDRLVASFRGTSSGPGWVVRAPDGQYLWDDPELGVRTPTCTEIASALRFPDEEAATLAAQKAFKSNFRKGMVVAV